MLSKAKEVVFFLTCLTLPSALAKTWRPPWSYLDGVFIDYWAPSLSASTIGVLLLWAIFLAGDSKNRAATIVKFRSFFRSPLQLAVTILFFFFLIGRPLFTAFPQISWVFLGESLMGPLLFLFYLWTDRKFARNRLKNGLLLAIFWQSLLAWQQIFTQSPLGPYWLTGEPRFTSGSFLTKSEISSVVRALPYGSTPHPNVLAGWLLLGILICKSARNSVRNILICVLFVLTLLATESVAGVISLPLLLFLSENQMVLQKILSGKPLMAPLGITLASTILWQLALLLPASFTNAPSVSRRIALLDSVFLKSNAWWLSGTSLIQQLSLTKGAMLSSFQGRFLQPVHSSIVSLVIDLGFGVFLLLYVFSILGLRSYSSFFWILLGVLPIFSLDHFAMTTLSGQFLVLILPLFFMTYFNE